MKMVIKKTSLLSKSILLKTSKQMLACDMISLKKALMENFGEMCHFRLQIENFIQFCEINLCYLYVCW